MGRSGRRKRRWACPFFGLTDDYKVQLHELIYDLASIGHLGYDAVYEMPVHYRMFYVRKLTKDREKEKEAYDRVRGAQEAPSSKPVARGPSIGPRG